MTPIANDSSRDTLASAERLTIAHLLLWTAGTGIALGYFRTFFDAGLGLRIQLSQQVFAFLLAPFYGAAIASLPWAAWQKLHSKRSFPQQPGHWLLVVQGVSLIAGVVATLATEPAEAIRAYPELTILLSTREFWRLVPTLFVTILAVAQMRELRWRWTFGLMATGYATCVFFGFRALGGDVAAYHLGTSLLWFFQTLSACTAIACAIYDRNEPLGRDFLNLVGLIVRVVTVAAWWLLPLLYLLVELAVDSSQSNRQ